MECFVTSKRTIVLNGRAVGRLLGECVVSDLARNCPQVAPHRIRGMLVGIYQNNVCLAIVLAALLNYFVHDLGYGWRISLGLQVAIEGPLEPA